MGSKGCWSNNVRSDPNFCISITHFDCSPGPITCFDSQEDYDQFWNNTLVGTPLQVLGSFTYQPDLDYFYSQVDAFQEQLDEFGKRCLESESGQYLAYIGTAAAVRDLLALSDYLNGPSSAVNFWVDSLMRVLVPSA
jgi:hypothetical protein